MILYPFRTIWLKPSQNRETLLQLVLDQTFLSDQGYRRTGDRKKYFFGEVSDQEFYLETIDSSGRLSPYIRGRMLGVGDETYIRLSLRGFRHQRAYILLSMFVLAGLVIFFRGLFLEGSAAASDMPFLIFGAVLISVSLFVAVLSARFTRSLTPTVDFFRGLFQADIIRREEVPGVFRL